MNTYMQRIIKRYFAIVLLAAGLQSSWGYSLLGPYESWQTSDIGYRQAYQGYLWDGLPTWLGDLGGPHNIGEEIRRNVPVVYYAFDASFATEDFFGSKAMAAVDSAAAIMNTVTNVDTLSSDLSEFPLNSLHYNQTAQSLYLSDIKSTTLHLLVEQFRCISVVCPFARGFRCHRLGLILVFMQRIADCIGSAACGSEFHLWHFVCRITFGWYARFALSYEDFAA